MYYCAKVLGCFQPQEKFLAPYSLHTFLYSYVSKKTLFNNSPTGSEFHVLLVLFYSKNWVVKYCL